MFESNWEATERGIAAGILTISNDVVNYIIGYSDNYGDPEEKVRAELFSKLVLDYGYPVERIKMEERSSFRRPHYPIDILVYEDDAQTIPYVVIECKKMNCSEREEHDGIEQAFENANLMNAGEKSRPTFVMFYSHDKSFVWSYGDYHKDQREAHEEGDLPIRYGIPVKFKYFKEVEGKDKKAVDETTMKNALRFCHQIIWHDTNKSGEFAFHEMVKLMFAALYDEQQTKIGEPYRFQRIVREREGKIAEIIRNLFREAATSRRELFEEIVHDQQKGEDISIIPNLNISDKALVKIVSKMESMSFSKSEFDVKGSAFETITSPIFRGEYGGYFTPRVVVDFMVKLLDAVSPIDVVSERFIDPACGSGGMLIALWNYARRELIPKLAKDPVKKENLSGAFASKRLFGVEIVPGIAQVAMINMILREDGSSNIELGSGVGSFNDYNNGLIKKGGFHGVITNPPFGDKIEDIHAITQSIGSKLFGKKKSVKSDSMFLLRSVELLQEDGRCAIVLPDSILNNPSDFAIRSLVRDNVQILGVISLPVETFMSSGANINTSILVFRKKTWKKRSSFEKAQQQIKNDIEKSKKKEASILSRAINRCNNVEIKSRLETRLQYVNKTKWKRIQEDRIDELKRSQNNYNIFIADVEKAGIDPTGRTTYNALPEVLVDFAAFLKNENKFKSTSRKHHNTKKIEFSNFTRWDALYYRDKYEENLKKVSTELGDLVPLSYYFDISYSLLQKNSNVRESEETYFKYVEISNVEITDGRIHEVEDVAFNELPSRAKWILKENDLLISTTRPYRGAISVAEKEHEGYIATSGFLVLRSRRKDVNVQAIKAFLRSSYGKLQLEQHMTGGAYPAIGTYELMERILVPKMTSEVARSIEIIHKEIGEESYQRKQNILAEIAVLEEQAGRLAQAFDKALSSKTTE